MRVANLGEVREGTSRDEKRPTVPWRCASSAVKKVMRRLQGFFREWPARRECRQLLRVSQTTSTLTSGRGTRSRWPASHRAPRRVHSPLPACNGRDFRIDRQRRVMASVDVGRRVRHQLAKTAAVCARHTCFVRGFLRADALAGQRFERRGGERIRCRRGRRR